MNLYPMEIRKSVFHGPAIQLLERLNADANWGTLIGQAGPDARLRDVELVARVLAMADGWQTYAKPMKSFLTTYMEQLKKMTPSVMKPLRRRSGMLPP